MKNCKLKRLSTHNTKGFFKNLRVGEKFTVNTDYFDVPTVKRLAGKEGLTVEWSYKDSAQTFRVTSRETRQTKMRFDEPGKPRSYGPKEAITAAEKMLDLKMNSLRPDYRAVPVIKRLLDGTGRLVAWLHGEHAHLGDEKFEEYYGAPYLKLLDYAIVLENVENDPDHAKAIAAVLHAHGLRHGAVMRANYEKLRAHGVQRLFDQFSDDFRGIVYDVTRINSELGGYAVIHCSCQGKNQFYPASNPHHQYDRMEDALFHEMFGEFKNAASSLYDAALKQKRRS